MGIISITGYAISNISGNSEQVSKEKLILDKEIPPKDIKSSNEEKKVITLSKEKVLELYEKGYGIVDIEKANELSQKFEMSIEEILELKKEISDAIMDRYADNRVNASIINKDVNFLWNKVELELHTKKVLNQSKVSDKNTAAIEKNLRSQLIEADAKKDDISEEELKKIFHISDEEIELCKQNGINENTEIIFAKGLSMEKNIPLGSVLNIKKSSKDWETVKDKLEVENNER